MRVIINFIFYFILLIPCVHGQDFYTRNWSGFSSIPSNSYFNINSCSKIDSINNQQIGYDDIHGWPDGSMLSLNSIALYKSSIPFILQESNIIGNNDFPLDPIYNFIPNLRCFTMDYKGNFYFAGNSLYSYNLKQNNAPTLIRPIDSIKLLTAISFYYDKLYAVQNFASGNFFEGYKFNFVEILSDSNYRIKILFEFEVKTPKGESYIPFYTNFCLNTYTISCDSTVLFLTVSGGSKTFEPLGTEIFIVDLISKKLIPYCSLPKPFGLYGLASASETAHTKCRIALDLDDNNSTETTNGYYYVAPCPSDSLSLHDTDFSLYSIYYIDSLTIEFMDTPIDNDLEKLIFQSEPELKIEDFGSKIVARNNGNANSMHFKSLLKNLKYINTAYPVSSGSRKFVFKIYAEGKIESAMAEIILPERRPAGVDDTLMICSIDKEYDLFLELGFPKTPSGHWLEPTLGDSGWIRSGLNPVGLYHYVVNTSSCYSDTAILTVKSYPSIDINLGKDTTLCMEANIRLVSGINGICLWQDSSRGFSFLAKSSGWYWAEYRDIYGCKYRDSVHIIVLDSLSRKFENIKICIGDSINYKGKKYFSGQIILDTVYFQNICPQIMEISIEEDSLNINLPTILNLESGQEFIIHFNLDSSKIKSISWSPNLGIVQINDSTFNLNSTISQKYIFVITSMSGCNYYKSLIVSISQKENLFAPNIFSPNQDTYNDTWSINSSPLIIIEECSIYNYWGNLIYYISNNIPNWDGTFQGKICLPGVYVYYIKYKDIFGNRKIMKGDITLIR
ncbi:MAG: T9SS type B sorting domain-containing protein [Saprospiraceae bacterium]